MGYIEKFIERLGERFNIREIAFDRWGAVQMVQNLEGMGFTVVPSARDLRICRRLLGTDEADIGAEDRPRRASGAAVDDGQHLYPHRSGGEYQGG